MVGYSKTFSCKNEFLSCFFELLGYIKTDETCSTVSAYILSETYSQTNK